MKKHFILFAFAVISIANANALSSIPLAISSTPKIAMTENSRLSKEENLRLSQMKLFVSMTPSQYAKMKGIKLNLFQRFTFKITQHRMNKMIKHYEDGDGPTTLQKISWLLKGLILGPIAVILGYIFLKDEERELIKWIWFGFAGFTIIVVALLLTI